VRDARQPPEFTPVELEAIFLRAFDATRPAPDEPGDLTAALLAYRDALLGVGFRSVERRAARYAARKAAIAATSAAIKSAAAPVLKAIAKRHRMTVANMLAPCNYAVFSLPRIEAAWCLRAQKMSYPKIAIALDRKDHTTFLKPLRRFVPTAEQERALREIAGVEQVGPKLAAVA
jgi:hypothetical protein